MAWEFDLSAGEPGDATATSVRACEARTIRQRWHQRLIGNA